MPALSDGDLEHLNGVEAREIIRSLVDGVVPQYGARLFTAGRELWLRGIEEDLDDLGDESSRYGRVRIINGRYGDGKTHLMHLIIDLALREGFAVSYVVVSPRLPLAKWNLVYAAIGSTITTNTRPNLRGLRAVLDPISPDPAIASEFQSRAATIREVPGIDPSFATAVYRYGTQQTVNADWKQDLLLLGQWLEGAAKPLPEMGIHARISEENAAAMLRSLVLTLRYFGFRGVVILVDEVESVLLLKTPQRNDSYRTLRLLVDRQKIPNRTLMVASTTPAMFTDPDRGIPTYPALWTVLRPVASSGDFMDPSATIVDLTKTPLTTEHYIQIGQAIRKIHARARGWDPSPRVPDKFLVNVSEMAASGQLTLTFSATRVAVKLIAQSLELAFRNSKYDPMQMDMMMAFGEADAQLQESTDDG